jgi:hypothetical protein
VDAGQQPDSYAYLDVAGEAVQRCVCVGGGGGCIYIHVCVFVCVCVCFCNYIYMCVCVYIPICIYMHACMHVCINVTLTTHTHTHTHTHRACVVLSAGVGSQVHRRGGDSGGVWGGGRTGGHRAGQTVLYLASDDSVVNSVKERQKRSTDMTNKIY